MSEKVNGNMTAIGMRRKKIILWILVLFGCLLSKTQEVRVIFGAAIFGIL